MYVRVRPGKGGFKSKTVTARPTLDERREFAAEMRQKFGGPTCAAGGFAADIAVYLTRVSAMPTIHQRTAHLALWARELGRDRPRRSITSDEIEVILQGWLDTPTRPGPGQKGRPSGPDGLSPGAVRKRRTALQSFFAKMDGKKSKYVNPVKGTTNPKEPKAEARSIDYPLLERAIAAMPTTRDVKRGLPRPLSLAPIRAAVIAYTGIPPSLLKQVKPIDLQLGASVGAIKVQARIKGKGVEARTLRLVGDALVAFQRFHQANAYGPFTTECVNRSFKRGCKRVGLVGVSLYWLRHSFLTELYRVTRDEATVGRLGLHAKGSRVTSRYTEAAHEEVDAAAVAAFNKSLARRRQLALKSATPAAAAVHKSRRKLPAKVAQLRKVV
jgi:integrase